MYVVYWKHESTVSQRTGDKFKGKEFDNPIQAQAFLEKLKNLEVEKKTYQYGFVSCITKSW